MATVLFTPHGKWFGGDGFLPDVYVEKTIDGIRQNRDEFLEKAIELATQTILPAK